MLINTPTKRARVKVESFDPLKFMFQFCPICGQPVADHVWFDVTPAGAVACSQKEAK